MKKTRTRKWAKTTVARLVRCERDYWCKHQRMFISNLTWARGTSACMTQPAPSSLMSLLWIIPVRRLIPAIIVPWNSLGAITYSRINISCSMNTHAGALTSMKLLRGKSYGQVIIPESKFARFGLSSLKIFLIISGFLWVAWTPTRQSVRAVPTKSSIQLRTVNMPQKSGQSTPCE